MYIKTREPHPCSTTAEKAPTTHTGEHNSTAPLHQLPMPVPAVCTLLLFLKKKKEKKTNTEHAKMKNKTKKGGEGGERKPPQHTHTAHSASTGEQEPHGRRHRARNTKGVRTGEQAPSGSGHRTRTRTEGGKLIGRNGLHPEGPTNWGNPADTPGQWQERYSKATVPSPARLHRGP